MYIMLFLIKLWSYKCLEYRETVVVMRFLCHFRMRDFSSNQEMRFYNYKQKLKKDIILNVSEWLLYNFSFYSSITSSVRRFQSKIEENQLCRRKITGLY